MMLRNAVVGRQTSKYRSTWRSKNKTNGFSRRNVAQIFLRRSVDKFLASCGEAWLWHLLRRPALKIKAQRVAKCAAAKRSTERQSLMDVSRRLIPVTHNQWILIGKFIEITWLGDLPLLYSTAYMRTIGGKKKFEQKIPLFLLWNKKGIGNRYID